MRVQREQREQSKKSVVVRPIKNGNAKDKEELALRIIDFSKSIGWQLSNHAIHRLAMGHVVNIEGENYRANQRGEIRQCIAHFRERVNQLMLRVDELSHKFDR